MNIIKLSNDKQVIVCDNPKKEVKTAIYQEFAGLQTPEETLIYECLQSYGEETENGWKLRDKDTNAKRKQELRDMEILINGYQSGDRHCPCQYILRMEQMIRLKKE